MSDFQQLTDKIIAFRDARDWKQFHGPKDLALALVLEAAEVLEHFRWKDQKQVEDYIVTHKNEIGDEIADTLYFILLLAHELDLDLYQSFDRKMEKNAKNYPVEKSKGSVKKYTEL